MPRCYSHRLISLSLWTTLSLLMYFWYSYKEYEARQESEFLEQQQQQPYFQPATRLGALELKIERDDAVISSSSSSSSPSSSSDMTTTTTTTVMTTTRIRKTTTKDPMDVYNFSDSNSMPSADGIINPHPFSFIMNPASLCNGSDVFLLIYIHSHPDNFDRRQTIRETWGDVSRYHNFVVHRVFVMGQTDNPVHSHLLRMEYMHYKDIVQENFTDTYRNLTYKAIAALKWVTRYCGHAKFILKTDDDAFVNLFVVLRHLKSKLKHGQYGNGTLACNAWYKSKVSREGKWAVSMVERKHPVWPTFCQGLAYIMTPDVVAAFYAASFDVPYLWMDDVYVTGFLARRLGIRHTQIEKTFIGQANLEKCISGSHWYRCLFSHIKYSNVTQSLWKTLLNKPGLPT